MRIIVSTHEGTLYDEEINYFVCHSQDGEFAVLEDHLPVVSVIETGYVKMVNKEISLYVVVYNGILEFHDNIVNLLAQEAYAGHDIESAKKQLENIRNERLELNRKETTDFTQKEKELRENLKKAKAGSL